MRIALCQVPSSLNDVNDNISRIGSVVAREQADVYIFPEMFLSGYAGDPDAVSSDVDAGIRKIATISKEKSIGIICGYPAVRNEKKWNVAAFIHDGCVDEYYKINLAQFGPFTEKDRFSAGNRPLIVRYKEFVFGLSICYDLFFPEMMKFYAMNGVDANVCISASPATSKKAFDAVLPARAVETTTYVLFVNNAGENTEFFGGSRCISPSGDVIVKADDSDCVMIIEISPKELSEARRNRPTISDTRGDIHWRSTVSPNKRY